MLHEQVLSHLAGDPTIHTYLPLLGVSHYWRTLTLERLIAEFSHTSTKSDQWIGPDFEPDFAPGGFVKESLMRVPPLMVTSYGKHYFHRPTDPCNRV